MPQTAVADQTASPGQSTAPDGTSYAIPGERTARRAFTEIERAAERRRAEGAQVVVVQGLGFVGTAVSAVIAGARDAHGSPRHFVIGVDLGTPQSYWKVAALNEGHTPVVSPDPELGRLIEQGATGTGNLRATTCEEAYALADVIVVDVHLDVVNRVADSACDVLVDMDAFKAAMRTVGRLMRPEALVLVETTVPIGTCEKVVLPILREERARRGISASLLLAHAYERVMPGPSYVDSIRSFWRSFAGVDQESAAAASNFLSGFVDTAASPPWELEDTVSSELGKLLENSYRSMNIAFIYEWTLLAESIGVNLFEVVDAIRVRKGTHDNMRYPGFGVGGYCLTKDSLLAQWGARHLLGSEVELGMTLAALKTNHLMPLHTAALVRELIGKDLAGASVTLLGVSYIADLADTRNSPAEILVDDLLTAGASLRLHDPHVREWPERPHVPVVSDLSAAVSNADAVVLAVPHRVYRELPPDAIIDATGTPAVIVDGQNIVSDVKVRRYRDAGWRAIGVGKGHWRKKGYHLRP